MSYIKPRPFLILQDESGNYRLTVRSVRYNSQDYPIVESELQDEVFKTVSAAKVFARENFRAQNGEFSLK